MYDPTFQAKIFPVLRDVFNPLATVWDGRFYYMVPPDQSTYPCGVYQSQDSGGRANDTINGNGWEGLITFRSIARSLSESENKLLSVAGLLPMVTHSGYDIRIRLNNPLPLPIEQDSESKIYTIGLITQVGVYPK